MSFNPHHHNNDHLARSQTQGPHSFPLQSQPSYPSYLDLDPDHADPSGQSRQQLPGAGPGEGTIWMNNSDPTGEFMYQMPPAGAVAPAPAGGGGGGKGKGDEATEGSQPLDLKALNARLQDLGLQVASSTNLPTSEHQQARPPTQPPQQAQGGIPPGLGSAFRTDPVSPRHSHARPVPFRQPRHLSEGHQPYSQPQSQHNHPYYHDPNAFSPPPITLFSQPRKPPTALELGPSDSLSQMYRPYRGPAPESVRSGRSKSRSRLPHGHGGTNVAPGQDAGVVYADEDDGYMYEDEGVVERQRDQYEQHSAWETRGRAVSDAGRMEAMTPGRTEWYPETTVNPNMLAMRTRLLANDEADQAAEVEQLNQHLLDATQLATALAKLESTEEQLRTLQATLIAERVARTQMERHVQDGEGNIKDIKNELSAAVRALRRARDEGRRNEEERRRLARCFEETKVQLYKYHEELKVRDARAKGREEGRAEAWQEAERWMGGDPPIPVDPIQSIPPAVLRQTPMPGQASLPGDLNAHKSPSSQPQQHGHLSPPQGQQAYSQPNQQSFGQAMGGGPDRQQDPPSRIMPEMAQQPPSRNVSGSGPAQSQANDDVQPSRVMPSMGVGPLENAPQQQQQNASLGQAIPVLLQPIGAPVPMQQAPLMAQQQQQQQNHRTPGPQAPTQLGMSTNAPVIPSGPPPHPAHEADAYLDRAEHNPRLREMLQGTQTKTIHTSHYARSEHPMTAQSVNKPLPTPGMGDTGNGNGLQRANTAAPGGGRVSRAGTMFSVNNSNGGFRNRRNSLMSGLHAHSHTQSNRNGGDRYPAFPHQNHGGNGQGHRGHSKHSSYQSVDPANIALPKSAFQTPATTRPDLSARPTPNINTGNRSISASKRSKVAGALRGGTDIDGDGELSDIIEDEQEQIRRSQMMQNQQTPQMFHPVPQRAHQPPMGDMPPAQEPTKRNYAPTMPPLRNRPTPRMPQPLGAAEGHNRSGSEPAGARGMPNPYPDNNMGGHGAMGQDEAVSRFNNQLPDPPKSNKPEHTHDLFVPPGMAPMAVHGSVHDVGGPRTSALGLEGLEDQHQNPDKQGRSRAGTMGEASTVGFGGKSKAPTSSYTRSGPKTVLNTPLSPVTHPTDTKQKSQGQAQPPRSASRASRGIQNDTTRSTPAAAPAAVAIPTADGAYRKVEPHVGPPQDDIASPIKSPHRVTGDLRPQVYHPHDIPLPRSKSVAPTVYSGYSPARTLRSVYDFSPEVPQATYKHAGGAKTPGHARSRSNTLSRNANRNSVYLPTPPQHAPAPTQAPTFRQGGARDGVSVIDFAQHALQKPLPDSRPTTIFSMAPPRKTMSASVTTVSDPDEPYNATIPAPRRSKKSERTNMTGGAGMGMGMAGKGILKPAVAPAPLEPHQVPLPMSRAGTHRRGPSTYAGTVAPIEELTEEENLRQARPRRY